MTILALHQKQFENRYLVDIPHRTFNENAVVVRRAGGVVGWWRRADGTTSGWISQDVLRKITADLWPGSSVPLAG